MKDKTNTCMKTVKEFNLSMMTLYPGIPGSYMVAF